MATLPWQKIRSVTSVSASPVASDPVHTNVRISPFNIGFGVVATGAPSYRVQYTFDNVYDMTDPATSATWFDHAEVSVTTGDTSGNFAFPVAAIQVYVSSANATTDSVSATFIQAGIAGN